MDEACFRKEEEHSGLFPEKKKTNILYAGGNPNSNSKKKRLSTAFHCER